jgi:hypothetical protein
MAAEAVGVRWSESMALALRRGPYVVAAGLDESVPDAAPITCKGDSSICSTRSWRW